MKLPKEFAFPSNQDIRCKTTEDINAQKLFTLFLDDYEPFAYYVQDQELIQELYRIAGTVEDGDLKRKMSDAISHLCASLCIGFMEFVAACPHIHIIID